MTSRFAEYKDMTELDMNFDFYGNNLSYLFVKTASCTLTYRVM